MKEISKKINSFHNESFSLETVNNMHHQLLQKQDKLLQSANEIHRLIEQQLINNNGFAVQELKQKFKKVKIDYEDNEDEIKKVINLRQKKILHNRLTSILGSEKRVNIKESIIMFLIMFVLGLLYYDITHPTLSNEIKSLLFCIDFSCCMIFLGNFYFEYRLADSKKWYWKTHIIDFVTSIPLPDAQLLRLGRTFRLVRLTRIFRFARILKIFRFLLFFFRGLNALAELFNVRLMKKSFLYCIVLLVVGACIIYTYEGGSSNPVSTIIDSIWWSFNTVVTGGYADLYNPVSGIGKVLTVILIIAGMVLVGIFTASLTSVIVGGEEENNLNDLKQEISKRLDKIEDRLNKKN